MPIYEYRCAGCGTDFELTRSMSQSGDPAPCPSCGQPAKKLVSSFASKADYAIKVPAKEPFRAPAPSSAAAKPAAKSAARPAAKAAGSRRTSKAK
jgi:putative FmdB family regulatory protein